MRYFCKACGTHVYAEDKRLPNVYGVPAGILESGSLPGPGGHYFVGHKATWHSITDTVPQFGGASGFEPLDG